MRREERSVPSMVLLTFSHQRTDSRRRGVENVDLMFVYLTWHIRAGVGQLGTPSNISGLRRRPVGHTAGSCDP